MKKDNPFTLTSGRQSTEYINRYESTETILSAFTAERPVTQAYLLEGVRGCGKTVMLTTVTKQLAEMDDWIVADLNPNMDLLNDLAGCLSNACQNIIGFQKNGFSISAAGFGIGLNGNSTSLDHIGEIEKILLELKKKIRK